MSIKDFTGDDWKKVALATLVPGASLAALGHYYKDPETIKWWESSHKADWMPKDLNFYGALDTVTILPWGLASYLVYKNGGGFDNHDTKVALGLYGLNIAGLLGAVVAQQRDWKKVTYMCAGFTALGGLTTYQFHKIDETAGHLMMPSLVWMAFGLFWSYKMWEGNP